MTTPRIFLSPPQSGARERELVLEAMDSGYVAPAGPMLERFEQAFADYIGQPYAVAVSSGTAALHLALRMLDLGPGDAVISPTLTFIGGVAPIAYQGATPIFVDCEAVCWGLDPALLDEAFDRAEALGLKARAVIAVDLYGQVCEVEATREVCERRGAVLLLDSAEAVGALCKGRHAGQGGMAAAFSFNGNKIMTTSGGGMLVSTDAALIERARYLSTAARQPAAHYEHTEVGFNYRLSNISAAIGLAQLETIEDRVAGRRALFETYRRRLEGVGGITFAPEGPDRRHTRWLTVVLLPPGGPEPEAVRLALEAENIESRPLWKPMHLQPAFRDAPMVGGAVSEDLFARGLCLPSAPSLTAAEIDRICRIVEEAVTAAPSREARAG